VLIEQAKLLHRKPMLGWKGWAVIVVVNQRKCCHEKADG